MSKERRVVGVNISAFHYYHIKVFVENLKPGVEIFHAGFLPWPDFFFPHYISAKLNLANSFVEKCIILPTFKERKTQQLATISLGNSNAALGTSR